MERLLTTKDLQQILQVDRITIYRMLDAGELPGIKVGGQWRFPEQAVNEWLQSVKGKRATAEASVSLPAARTAEPASPEAASRPPKLVDLISTVCLQNVQDGFAEALGVASLVIDLQGTPITQVSRACAFCRAGWASEEFKRRCSVSWASLAEVSEAQPQVHLCHAGIGYAVAPIEVHGTRLGLVIGGQFHAGSQRPEVPRAMLTALASECSLPPSALLDSFGSIPVFGPEKVALATRLLATIATTLSEIGFQAYEVRKKLQQIAEIARNL